MYRTHTCGELNKSHEKADVILSGWVQSRRDHGGIIFIDLRDRYGLTQVAFDPERNKQAWEIADQVRSEFVIKVQGTVALRPDDMKNSSMATGDIEIDGASIEILSKAETPPFEIEANAKVNEETRLEYRYLDLRRPDVLDTIMLRSKVIRYIRNWMTDRDFLEIQTPLLTSSSPEGARDFLVPSRLHNGKFYALPQAPQQYKQLLMVGGIDRYFQIAPCFRDEDTRADRSAEFYQLDTEVSFMTQDEFLELMEPLFIDITKEFTDKKLLFETMPRLTYKESMERFGTDSPDLRYGFELTDVTGEMSACGFGVFENAKMVKGICITQAGDVIGRNEIDRTLTPFVKEYGAAGLAWMRMTESGLESSITKFFTEEALQAIQNTFKPKAGDLLFFVADSPAIVHKALGALRVYCADKVHAADPNTMAYCWIVDYPMYEYDDKQKKIDFSHNPFSMPQGGIEALNNMDPLDVLAYQYDLVCNGVEISSGGVRNANPDIMYRAFEIAGYKKEVVDEQFGHMIKAFTFGAPPHCGFAPGIERMIMLLSDKDTIRDVIAFPKNNKAQEVMLNSPAEVDEQQLKDLGLSLRK